MRAKGVGVVLLVAATQVAAGQTATLSIGPQVALASYDETASGLGYQGTGFGGVVSGRYGKFSAMGTVVRVQLDPRSGSTATAGFTSTEVDAWVGYDLASYASVEVGLAHRSADPELDAQSMGAVRVGARSFHELGPGATVLFRANYLAAPQFSGGGHASFSLDLGLGLDVRLAGHVHGTAAYTFQRIDRKTNPGGTGEVDAPIQETVARVGVSLAF